MNVGAGLGGQSATSESALFYRFTDASGRLHIVDSLDLVPPAFQARAERLHYGEQSPGVLPPALHAAGPWRTLALGFVGLMLLWFLARRLPGTLRFGLLGLAVLVLSGAYFGWLRQTTRNTGATFASPTQLIDDAKQAVEKMNARLRVQRAELKEAEQAK